MMTVLVMGGGAAMAQPIIDYYMERGETVIAVCRDQVCERATRIIGGVDLLCVEDLRRMRGMLPEIDLMITLPAVVENRKVVDMGMEEWDGVVRGTMTTVFNCFRHVGMLMRSGGNVVVVGSIVGSTGGYGCSNYAAAKAGLVGLVRSVAQEWQQFPIYVNLLELGYINIGMGNELSEKVKEAIIKRIPLGRFGDVREVVKAIAFLGETKYMSGDVLTMAGGLRS